MWYFAIALILGILLGALAPLSIPLIWARYLSIVLLAAIDATLGGLRAGIEGKFDFTVFSSGFIVNGIMAAGLTYVGDRLGVELYYAALFAFGYRIFLNLGVIRRELLYEWRKRRAERQGKTQA